MEKGIMGNKKEENIALKGTHGYVMLRNENTGGDEVTQAIIRNEGKEIAIDYKHQGNVQDLILKSNDGIHFEGEYQEHGKRMGSCSFTLYKNAVDEYLLFGTYYDRDEGDNGILWIELHNKGVV